jgi:hypothetical protein
MYIQFTPYFVNLQRKISIQKIDSQLTIINLVDKETNIVILTKSLRQRSSIIELFQRIQYQQGMKKIEGYLIVISRDSQRQ